MPWTTADVDRFQKGLSADQKKRWVAVANSSLSRCRAKGGKDCDATAIKTANGFIENMGGKESYMTPFQMTRTFHILEQQNDGYMRFRQTPPGDYERFRIIDIKPGIKQVIGFKKGGGSETQSVLFDPKKFNKADAVAWLKDHKFKGLTAAESDQMRPNDEAPIYNLTPVKFAEADLIEKDGKHELIVTLLREGPGNQFHNNWYLKPALESAKNAVELRKKQYFNHAKDVDNPERDIQEWCSSIMETWIDNDGESGRTRLQARVKVYDEWLWKRAKDAPDELAVSIEGRGAGKPQVIEGKQYNAIHSISQVNGVNWVDYPGNAGMGVQVLESDRSNNPMQEDKTMELTDILEAMNGLTKDELSEVAKSKPELKEFFVIPASDNKKEIQEMRSEMKSLMDASKQQIEKMQNQITALEKDKAILENKVEAHDLREKSMSKEKLVDKMLADSKLDKEHVTERFRKSLLSVKEYKEGDKTVTESDQIKELIEDREKIVVAHIATPSQPGDGKSGDLSEDEKGKLFVKNVFGIEITEDASKKNGAAA